MRMLPLFLAAFLTACTSGPPRPAEIEPADMCAFCKMAISQRRYAAELIDADRNVFKFDDIGCMIQFAKQRGWIGQPPARFVHDYDSPEWLDAGRASFVLSSGIPSPMASGLLAVKDRAQAERYAARFQGSVRSLSEIWK